MTTNSDIASCVDLQVVADTIVRVARHHEARLRGLDGKGIFFMPELAFAFEVGVELAENKGRVFTSDIASWHREFALDGGGGPSDLYFQLRSKTDDHDIQQGLVIELKMISTYHKYLADIDKLRRLEGQAFVRVFAVLVDSFESSFEDDDRVRQLRNKAATADLIVSDSFPTWNHIRGSERKMWCHTLVWWVPE